MSFDLVCLESQPVLSTDLIDFFLSSPKSWEAWSEGSCICFYPDLSLVIKHWANWANSISQYKKRTFYLITCNNFAMQDFNTKLYLSVNTQLCYQIIQIQMKSFFLPDWKNIVKKKTISILSSISKCDCLLVDFTFWTILVLSYSVKELMKRCEAAPGNMAWVSPEHCRHLDMKKI